MDGTPITTHPLLAPLGSPAGDLPDPAPPGSVATDPLLEILRSELRPLVEGPITIASMLQLERRATAIVELLRSRGPVLAIDADRPELPVVAAESETFGATVLRELLAALPAMQLNPSEIRKSSRAEAMLEVLNAVQGKTDPIEIVESIHLAARDILEMPIGPSLTESEAPTPAIEGVT